MDKMERKEETFGDLLQSLEEIYNISCDNLIDLVNIENNILGNRPDDEAKIANGASEPKGFYGKASIIISTIRSILMDQHEILLRLKGKTACDALTVQDTNG